MRFYYVVLFLLLLQNGVSFGQTETAEAIPRNPFPPIPEELQYPLSLYKEAILESQNLYNGRVYYIYDPRMEEHQFFTDRKWYRGSVLSEGQRYDSIPMMYDIVKDQLVVRHLNGDPMVVASEKVKCFTNYGELFIWYEKGKGIEPTMVTGFYNLFYDGPTHLLIRRTKTRQEKIVDRKVITVFPQKDFYYVRKGGQYYAVRSKKSFLSLFPDHKRALRRVLRKEDIMYRQDRAYAIKRMLTTYDELAKP
ncbi:hypothetical protein DSL64_08890 [Dyadobacter luteus]|uniref:YARHG domain-containing protein n=1 Tax=Dyadobacter luteus TaxID=2259619 RepID=A0A3D8YGB3_9BACT|nr:hypothetical protein [Dyadobacter luteus]REA62369.1 hypothetical protein DSL64_08890 [Dyadobacter luteus]